MIDHFSSAAAILGGLESQYGHIDMAVSLVHEGRLFKTHGEERSPATYLGSVLTLDRQECEAASRMIQHYSEKIFSIPIVVIITRLFFRLHTPFHRTCITSSLSSLDDT